MLISYGGKRNASLLPLGYPESAILVLESLVLFNIGSCHLHNIGIMNSQKCCQEGSNQLSDGGICPHCPRQNVNNNKALCGKCDEKVGNNAEIG